MLNNDQVADAAVKPDGTGVPCPETFKLCKYVPLIVAVIESLYTLTAVGLNRAYTVVVERVLFEYERLTEEPKPSLAEEDTSKFEGAVKTTVPLEGLKLNPETENPVALDVKFIVKSLKEIDVGLRIILVEVVM